MPLVSINKKVDASATSSTKSKKTKKFPKKLLAVVLIMILVLGIFSALVYSGVKSLKKHGAALAAAYQSQNYGQIQTEVSATKGALQQISIPMNVFFWFGWIPGVGGYYSDARGLVNGGVQELEAVDKLLTDMAPDQEALGFTGQPIAGQDRIGQGMKILSKSLPFLNSIQGNLQNAASDVQGIDSSKYPTDFRGVNLQSLVSRAKNFMLGANEVVKNHRELLDLVPKLLGEDSPKNYLILFQNDKEIRPTGGFITAFANLNVNKGKVTATTSDDIYRLDEQLLKVCENKICPLTPPAPIVRYLPEVSGKPRSAWSMRDSNLSPDVPTSAKQFESMYQLLGNGLPFDGIIYIDSQVVDDIIKVTGPIEVLGTMYTAEIDSRCNCPNVIYELENYAEIAAKGSADRKSILGVLMQQILARALGSDVTKLPTLAETVVNLANEKHIMFYMHDPKVQSALSSLNWIGEVVAAPGDYLYINDANFAGGKSNLYVTQNVTQDIKTGQNGKTLKTVTIEYKNSQPFGIWLNGINRDYVRLLVPKGSKLISSKGSENAVQTSEDLGKTVFEAFITVRPQNYRILEFKYEIPYNPSGKYDLTIQKQPGSKDFEYKILINGNLTPGFILNSDKELEFNI